MSGEGTIAAVLANEAAFSVSVGDCLPHLRALPDASIDAIVTDPPAGIAFMAKAWDRDKGGRDQWIAWLAEIMRECLRVLKPGGYAVVWALPRTSHWTATAIEDAGFEIRDKSYHLFGSGFPKSLSVSKEIDRIDGASAAREVVSTYTAGGNAGVSTADKGGTYGVGVGTAPPVELAVTRGASERSRAWDGWGTALKPAAEEWILARKPLESTVAANVLKHCTGALNIDGCRVATDWNEPDRPESWKRSGHTADADAEKIAAPPGQGIECHPGGRWPSNVVFSHSVGCGDECAEDCPVAELGLQSGILRSGDIQGDCWAGGDSVSVAMGRKRAQLRRESIHADTGTAARFFHCFRYEAKPSTSERDAGLDGFATKSGAELTGSKEGQARLASPRSGAGRGGGRKNIHPTVKGLDHMRYLCRLVCRRGGIVLDPFAGSGSTGCAAAMERMRFVGFEMEAEHAEIARARIAYWEPRQAELFGEVGT